MVARRGTDGRLMRWMIGVPVWGSQYIERFIRGTLPAINAALREIDGDVRFVVHTDDPSAFVGVGFRGRVQFYPVPWGNCLYTTFGNAHRELLELAGDGDALVFLTADIVVSRECFANAERRFAEGKRAIVVTAARTLATEVDCPVGMSARELIEWSFAHRHPVTDGCYWGKGRNTVTWAIYFEGEHGTVLRAFHLHPFAVLNDRPLYFDRETVDLDLLERYGPREIHVVTDPDEMAFAEVSGLDKDVPQGDVLNTNSVVDWARGNTTRLHRWLFQHRIVVRGSDGDHLDEAPAAEILGVLG